MERQQQQQQQQRKVGEFISAAALTNLARARALLNSGLDVDSVDRETTQTLLMSVRSFPDFGDMLLGRGARVDIRDKWGHDALQLAVADGWIDSAELLIRHGASVNTRNNDGHTVIRLAVGSLCYGRGGDPRILDVLCRHGAGADLDVKGNDGWSARDQAREESIRLPAGL